MNREGWKETVRRLSLEEFRVLQEVIWEEHRGREAQQLAGLRTGDWVEFEDYRSGRALRGVVTRMNRRTVSVDVPPEDGHAHPHHWRVSVTLVRRILPGETPPGRLPPGAMRAVDADKEAKPE